METIIKISQTPAELSADLAGDLAEMIGRSAFRKKQLNIALPGGNTPRMLFSIIAEQYAGKIPWDYVQLFWGDERCVPSHDAESNYGMAKMELLDKIEIPQQNIHRIRGEDDPFTEAERYSEEIIRNTLQIDDLPVFDLIILGLGQDGHTASIFPGDKEILTTKKVCIAAKHPGTGKYRITLTAPVINNAGRIIFLVTGSNKAGIVADIIENPGIVDYPAAFIEPAHGVLEWFLDLNAASELSQWA